MKGRMEQGPIHLSFRCKVEPLPRPGTNTDVKTPPQTSEEGGGDLPGRPPPREAKPADSAPKKTVSNVCPRILVYRNLFISKVPPLPLCGRSSDRRRRSSALRYCWFPLGVGAQIPPIKTQLFYIEAAESNQLYVTHRNP